MKLVVHKPVLTSFRRKAREAYDVEEFGVLLGRKADHKVVVRYIYYPDGRLAKATTSSAGGLHRWYDEAAILGKKMRLVVVGDIHSHCYDYNPTLECPGREPSETDWVSAQRLREYIPTFCLFGVCRVRQCESKRLMTSVKWWTLGPDFTYEVVL